MVDLLELGASISFFLAGVASCFFQVQIRSTSRQRCIVASVIPDNESKTKVVQMRLLPGTIKRISQLQEAVNASNRTDAVKSAVDIAFVVVDALQKRQRVIIEDYDDEGKVVSRNRVLIPGLGT